MRKYEVYIYKVVGEIKVSLYAENEDEAKKIIAIGTKDRPFSESNCTAVVMAFPKEETQKIKLVPVEVNEHL
jgi:hypothetical protein